jgi:hypothetical protein
MSKCNIYLVALFEVMNNVSLIRQLFHEKPSLGVDLKRTTPSDTNVLPIMGLSILVKLNDLQLNRKSCSFGPSCNRIEGQVASIFVNYNN